MHRWSYARPHPFVLHCLCSTTEACNKTWPIARQAAATISENALHTCIIKKVLKRKEMSSLSTYAAMRLSSSSQEDL